MNTRDGRQERHELPYYMSTEPLPVALCRLRDGRHQKIRDEPYGPLMVGPGYVLMEEALARFLAARELPGLRFAKAVLWDSLRRLEQETYLEALIQNRFTSDKINDVETGGERVFLMGDQYVFVSGALKAALEQGGFPFLRFSLGLSRFADGPTPS